MNPQLFFTVVAPTSNGYGTIAAYITYDEAYRHVIEANSGSVFLGIPRSADELEQYGIAVPLTEVRPDPFTIERDAA